MSLAQPKKAMVLAAGLGTRMRPLTDTIPKPLIPVAGKALIDHILDWLASSGITEAVVNSFYKAEMLEKHLAVRRSPAIRISREEVLLETGGGIRKALPMLGAEPFFAFNSDTICIDGATPTLERMAQTWDDTAMDALLLVHPVSRAIGYEGRGDFWLDDNGCPRRRREDEAAPYVFTGAQLLHPRLFAGAPEGPFSMNVLYNRGMGKDGTLRRIGVLVHDGDWLHIGTPEELKRAETWLG